MDSPHSQFYLAIKYYPKHKDTEWYKRQPLGEKTILAIMKNMAKQADLPGRKTNLVPENLHVRNFYILDFTQY